MILALSQVAGLAGLRLSEKCENGKMCLKKCLKYVNAPLKMMSVGKTCMCYKK